MVLKLGDRNAFSHLFSLLYGWSSASIVPIFPMVVNSD